MMHYGTRIAIGALLGLAAAVGLWFVGLPWLTAVVAGLLAPVGFLGSYFVWSADRPQEGYEQVLFDRPNTLVAAILLVAFAGAGFGSGLLGADDAPPAPADRVYALRGDFLAASGAWSKDAGKDGTLARVAELRVESDRIALDLEALPAGDARHALEMANDALAFALDALKLCAEKEERGCLDARLSAADAEAALQRYATLLDTAA